MTAIATTGEYGALSLDSMWQVPTWLHLLLTPVLDAPSPATPSHKPLPHPAASHSFVPVRPPRRRRIPQPLPRPYPKQVPNKWQNTAFLSGPVDGAGIKVLAKGLLRYYYNNEIGPGLGATPSPPTLPSTTCPLLL